MLTHRDRDIHLLNRLVGLGAKKICSVSNQQAQKLIREEIALRIPGKYAYSEEKFPVKVCSCSQARVCFDNKHCNAYLLDYTGSQGTSVKGELIYLGSGAERDFKNNDVQGKIVACRYGLANHRILQVERAKKYNAAGIIIISGHNDLFQIGTGYPEFKEPSVIPALSITKNDWSSLSKYVRKQITLEYQQRIESGQARNLIFDLLHDEIKEYIVIGTHFDSWNSGAQDNSIGVVMLVALAESVARREYKKNIRLIFFDAEEIGMVGSKWHVNHTDTNNYIAYINLEMPIPCKNTNMRTILFSNEPHIRNSVSFTQLLCNRFLPVPLNWFYWISNSLFPSDVDSFFQKGIPCMTTYCSNIYYHTSEDTVDKLNLKMYPVVLSMIEKFIRKLESF
ncbi:MAG: M28 family peptidase [Candidatus Omnitrophica bacterium]|nr:M28 family peptidase [Candidatus Omnitrophota bacterium]